jgi:hypothetical protein
MTAPDALPPQAEPVRVRKADRGPGDAHSLPDHVVTRRRRPVGGMVLVNIDPHSGQQTPVVPPPTPTIAPPSA